MPKILSLSKIPIDRRQKATLSTRVTKEGNLQYIFTVQGPSHSFSSLNKLHSYLSKQRNVDTWEIQDCSNNSVIYKHKILGEIETLCSERELNYALSKENDGVWKVVFVTNVVSSETSDLLGIMNRSQGHYVIDQSGWWFSADYKKYSLAQTEEFLAAVADKESQQTQLLDWNSCGMEMLSAIAQMTTSFNLKNTYSFSLFPIVMMLTFPESSLAQMTQTSPSSSFTTINSVTSAMNLSVTTSMPSTSSPSSPNFGLILGLALGCGVPVMVVISLANYFLCCCRKSIKMNTLSHDSRHTEFGGNLEDLDWHDSERMNDDPYYVDINALMMAGHAAIRSERRTKKKLEVEWADESTSEAERKVNPSRMMGGAALYSDVDDSTSEELEKGFEFSNIGSVNRDIWVASSAVVSIPHKSRSLKVHVKNIDDIKLSYDEIEMIRQLGYGAFGTTYPAKWRGIDVAVKRLIDSDFSDELENKFLQEVLTWSRLSSRHVVKLHGVCVDKKPYALVREHIKGRTLYNLLHSEAPLLWDRRATIMLEVGKGLKYLHDNGIIYQNLNSQNILITQDGRVKLNESLLSIEESISSVHAISSTDIIGDVRRLAPELLGGRMIYSEESDVYSYGMVIWEIASRKIPYENLSTPRALIRIMDGETEQKPEGIADQLWEIIVSCWHKDPHQRPSAREVMHRLNASKASIIVAENSNLEDVGKKMPKKKVKRRSSNNSALSRVATREVAGVFKIENVYNASVFADNSKQTTHSSSEDSFISASGELVMDNEEPEQGAAWRAKQRGSSAVKPFVGAASSDAADAGRPRSSAIGGHTCAETESERATGRSRFASRRPALAGSYNCVPPSVESQTQLVLNIANSPLHSESLKKGESMQHAIPFSGQSEKAFDELPLEDPNEDIIEDMKNLDRETKSLRLLNAELSKILSEVNSANTEDDIAALAQRFQNELEKIPPNDTRAECLEKISSLKLR
jgi:serine/threonine protein kinase